MTLYNADFALVPAERPKSKDKTERVKAADVAKYKSEDQIQIEVARWLDHKLPKDWRWYHCPNGGFRKKATAGRFKAMGLKSGVPDIIICRPNGPDIWIELKSFGGVLQATQKEWRDWAKANGRPFFVARSVGEVEACLKDFIMRSAA